MQKVFISILNYNNTSETVDCLDSIKKLRVKNIDLHTLVIDNASKEFNLDAAKYSAIQLEVIKNKQNLGFSGGHNIGISYSLRHGADFVLILNNDTVLDKNLLVELINGFEKDKHVGITVPKIYFSKGSEYHKKRYKETDLGKVIWFAGGKMDWKNVIGAHVGVDEVDDGKFDESKEVEFGTGACMLVKRDVFEKVGMFNDKYFLYYEDADLFMRAKEKKYTILFVPSAFMWHHNASSSGGSGSPLQDYYITRNRLLFGLLYAPLRAKIALLREGTFLVFKGRAWQRKGARDFVLGNFGKGSFS